MPPASKTTIATFFTAYILSAFGYEFVFFLMTIYVYDKTHSALNVGVFAALTFIPRLFAPLYGVAVDRYGRVEIFGAAAVATAILVAGMGYSPGLLWIYAVWLLISVLLIVISTVRTALMTEIMAGDGFLLGNSAVLGCLNAAKILAPVLAGLASAVFRTETLFLATGAVYLVVAVLSRRLVIPPLSGPPRTRSVLAEVAAGLRYILASPHLRFLIAVGFLWALFLRLQLPLFVVYVKSVLGGRDPEYGLFMTVIGLGSILGSIAGPWLMRGRNLLTVALAGLTAHYASFVLLGLTDTFIVALAVVGSGCVFFYAALVGLHSLRDRATTGDLRGRVYASVTAGLTPPAVVSMLGGGYLANLFGAEKVLAGAGLAALTTLYLLYFFAAPGRVGANNGALNPQKEAG